MSDPPVIRPPDGKLPQSLRPIENQAKWSWRLSAAFRCLPDFLVIGAQKSGTTSLVEYLDTNPEIWMARCKECNYLSGPIRSRASYRAFFPMRATHQRMEHELGRKIRLGEGTPYDLFHPRAAQRAAAVIPSAQFIVLLRDPIERAYSHYQHCVRLGIEPLSFEDALAAESKRLGSEASRLMNDPAAVSDYHRHYSYIARGHYVDQIEHWHQFVDPNQMHIEIAEDLFTTPQPTLERIERFLGVTAQDNPVLPTRNASPEHHPIEEKTRQKLRSHYLESNRRLQELLGRTIQWAT